MIEFTLNNNTYCLPTSWNEVKYDQYQQIRKLPDDMSGTDKAVNIVAILTRMPKSTLEQVGFGLVVPLFEHLEFLKSAPLAVETEFVTVLGVNYYAQRLETMGELAAFDKISQAFPNDEPEKLPFILSILLRKRLESTEKEPKSGWLSRFVTSKSALSTVETRFEEFQNDFEWMSTRAKLFASQLSTMEVMGLAAFFLQSAELSRTLSLRYSEATRLQPMLNELLAATSAKSMDGWHPSSIWNRMFRSILRCYVWTLQRYLISYNTKRK